MPLAPRSEPQYKWFFQMRAAAVLLALLAGPGLAEPCRPFVEEHASGTAVSFRPHTSAFEACPVDEASYQRVLGDWLGTRLGQVAPRSVALGRAVQYPWLSRLIAQTAAADAAWRARAAATPPGSRDRLLAELLEQPAVLRRLAAPFENTPYQMAGVSFEKVLWGPDGLPFDAQLWLRLQRRPDAVSAPAGAASGPARAIPRRSGARRRPAPRRPAAWA